ncbi:MAG: leucyl/phenylalanyl-tRNA--protein transferase [Flavobacteriales bacterium]|nr:leucyl/phenylalanyl-tRNA--protein transferase [Flavobacteriales bacterium]
MVYWLGDKEVFPSPELANEEGLLAVGGQLSEGRLLEAYSQGIFPWFDNDDDPVMWWSPDPRLVLFPEELKISRSMRPVLNGNAFEVTFDQAFGEVIIACKSGFRKGQRGTWITDNMVKAYMDLHNKGWAHSVEVWHERQLVGGLYGISMGTAFFGESMFSKMSNASKIGFITLVQWLRKRSFRMIDCQVYTSHLASLGAREIPRTQFLTTLKECLVSPTLNGKWIYSND